MYKDCFALIPHKCNQCGKIIWLEKYRIYDQYFGTKYKIRRNYCKDCYLDKKYKFARIKAGV